MSKNKTKSNILKNKVMTALIKSVLIFTVIISASAFLCYFTDMDFSKYYIVLIIVSVISTFISGLSYSHKMKKNGIICGIIAASPIAVIVLVMSLILTKASVTCLLPITIAAIILSGAVSGTIGVNLGR